MIFVTVGSATYKFDRIFKILDELCEEGKIQGDLIFSQTGVTMYHSKNYKCVDMIKNNDFYKKVNDADLIICHAGVGTIINSITHGKKVIIFPRLSKYNEHVDDHQLEIANLFKKNNYVMCATNKNELIDCLEKVKKYIPNKFISTNGKIDDYIIDYLEGDVNGK